MPTASTDRRPIPFTDERGIACLRVPLDDKGREFAMIEQADYELVVLTIGAPPVWYLTSNGNGRRYVAVYVPQVDGQRYGLMTVARLFAGGGSRRCVRYATKDTRDLRRPNLVTKAGTGRARHDCAERMADVVRRRDACRAMKRAA